MQIKDGKTVNCSVEELYSFFQSLSKQEESTPQFEVTWVNGKELCNIFPVLSYGKVKDRQWRDSHNFPYYQEDICFNVRYNVDDVSKWIDARKNKSPYQN